MTTTAVLGIDPGPTLCGWGVVDGQPPRFVAGGMVGSTSAELQELLALYPGAVVAIESIEWRNFGPARTGPLMATSHIAGLLEGLANGRKTHLLPAAMWRRMLTGRTGPTDARIKLVVCSRLRDMPSRSSSHVRDALGCALAAQWIERTPGRRKGLVWR